MPVKYEWRKREKALYLPKAEPTVVDVPTFRFLSINGEGSPGDEVFSTIVGTLYSVAYAIKMQPKKMKVKPAGYFDFTVYPLEGVWDLNEKAKENFSGTINKDDFVYQLMIRQPDFVDSNFYQEMLQQVKEKKPNSFLDKIDFQPISEGKCIQMLHLGSFDEEPLSFEKMETFAENEGHTRLSKAHREIYLSNALKTAPDKLKTVLRFRLS